MLARMFIADAQTLRCDRGTIFGRDVVPEVCSTRAMSSGSGVRPAAGAPGAPEVSSENEPAPDDGRGTSARMATPSRFATSTAGDALPASTMSALARRSVR